MMRRRMRVLGRFLSRFSCLNLSRLMLVLIDWFAGCHFVLIYLLMNSFSFACLCCSFCRLSCPRNWNFIIFHWLLCLSMLSFGLPSFSPTTTTNNLLTFMLIPPLIISLLNLLKYSPHSLNRIIPTNLTLKLS